MSIGFGQIIIIILVILLIFGASRLPKIAEDLAKGMKAFKRGLTDDNEDTKESPGSTPEPQAPARKSLPKKATSSSKSAPTKAIKGAKKTSVKKSTSQKKQSKAVKNA